MKERINALRVRMAQKKLDGLLITDLANMRYLVGYSGDNGILIITKTKNRSLFFTDFRYEEQSRREIKNAVTKIRNRDLYAVFPVEELKGIKRLGFETESITHRNYLRIKKQIKSIKFVPCENWGYFLRSVKDNEELRLIRKAASISDAVFTKILDRIKPGVYEKDLAAELDYLITRQAEIAFPTIVGAGTNGSLPHYQPGMKKLKKGEPVVFDFGARYQGYCSDMTRTLFVGKVDKKGRKIYSIVLEAQKRAIDAIKQGEKASEIDAKARDYITEKGYGKKFGHGLGHGVGLMVHEGPALAKTSQAILKPNQVVTVEPGIYLPDWGGVRIEDLVRVTKDGYENFTKSTKECLEI